MRDRADRRPGRCRPLGERGAGGEWRKVGRLTSGGYSVAFGKQIGMGYVRPDLAEVGQKLQVRCAAATLGCGGGRGQPLRSDQRADPCRRVTAGPMKTICFASGFHMQSKTVGKPGLLPRFCVGGACYQARTRCSGGSHIGVALGDPERLVEAVEVARCGDGPIGAGRCASLAMMRRRNWSDVLAVHICAQDRKQRCSGVKPSIGTFSSVCRQMLVQDVHRQRQPTDIGHVLADLDQAIAAEAGQHLIGIGLVDQLLGLSGERLASAGVHQSRMSPFASNCRPMLSNPWVSSCPITAPIRQTLTAKSMSGSYIGGWRMAAGISKPLSCRS